eukprot:3501070-Ditylum_brightwellii.AAC.1
MSSCKKEGDECRQYGFVPASAFIKSNPYVKKKPVVCNPYKQMTSPSIAFIPNPPNLPHLARRVSLGNYQPIPQLNFSPASPSDELFDSVCDEIISDIPYVLDADDMAKEISKQELDKKI